MSVMKTRGFSLIEVLIALLILSIGMLGVAGLFTHGVQAGRTAMHHQQALLLTGDVADRIRANPRAGASYEGTRSSVNCVSEFVVCDTQAMAGHDIAMWQRQATRTLPGGQVGITFDDSVSPPRYTIAVTWSEPNAHVPASFTTVIPVNSE